MMSERGIALTHTTILRWVQRYVPDFEKTLGPVRPISRRFLAL
jgi:transposase-like protein